MNQPTSTSPEQEQPSTIIYGVEDRPPFFESFFAALQHLLAILVPIIAPALIIAGAIGVDFETSAFLVSMALFASGIATFIQCRRFGPLGAGLLCVQGTSFSFLGPIIAAGTLGGLPLIFGTCIAASGVEILVSRVLRFMQKIITPLVSGVVVTMIGLSLVKVGIISSGGGFSAISDGSFAGMENLGLAGLVLLTILFFNRSSNRYLRMSSIVLGLLVGYIAALIMGRIDFSNLSSFGWVTIPMPFKYGLDFNWGTFFSIAIVYLITSIEAYGDITANSLVSGQPIQGEKYMKRITGGILADGVNSAVAGVFNSFPNSIFAQNNGMIQLTGVASRYVGYFVAAILVLMGIFPFVGGVFSLMPEPVLGGATLLMFGTVAAAGVRIIASQELNRKAVLIIALSFSMGLSVELVPDILKHMPQMVKDIFSSGITVGGVTAILANVLIRIKE